MTAATFTLLFTIPGAGAENEAEKLFRALEAKMAAAKVVKVSGSMNVEGTTSQMKCSVKFIFAKGNKANVRFEGEPSGKSKGVAKAMSFSLISDGTKMQLRVSTETKIELPAFKYLHDYLSLGISRLGLITGMTIMQLDQLKRTEANISQELSVSKFELKPAEKINGREALILSYTAGDDGDGRLMYTLWLDSKSGLPIKRTSVTKDGARVSEDYDEFVLDPKVDASSFDPHQK